jgi:hypothetical protein
MSVRSIQKNLGIRSVRKFKPVKIQALRAAIEPLEQRRMLTVGISVDYIAATGLLTIGGAIGAANNITVHTVAANSVEIDSNLATTFSLLDNAAGSNAADFVLTNGNRTVTVNTSSGHSPLTNFNINLGNLDDALHFSLAGTSGVGNVGINTGTGADVVNFDGNVNINGNLQDTGGAITVTASRSRPTAAPSL